MTEESEDQRVASAAQAWVNERARPGNWIDVSPDEEIHPGIIHWDRTLIHMQQIAFGPEIRRRIEAGTLPSAFLFWAGQLIQPRGGGQQVRLNDEVRGRPYLRTGRTVEKGGEVRLGDLANLEYFDLDDDELDSGHFTVFFTGIGWVGGFDFRSGRGKCVALVDKALNFLAATRVSFEKGLIEPSVDMLFTACELLAKTQLVLDRQNADEWTSHKRVGSQINLMSRHGNVSAAFLSIFNRLAQERNLAKYATGYMGNPLNWDDIEVVENMALALEQSVRPKRPDGEGTTR